MKENDDKLFDQEVNILYLNAGRLLAHASELYGTFLFKEDYIKSSHFEQVNGEISGLRDTVKYLEESIKSKEGHGVITQLCKDMSSRINNILKIDEPIFKDLIDRPDIKETRAY